MNPCDICEARDKSTNGCTGCALDYSATYGMCDNEDCMCNYESGCLLGLDDVCKASTCFKEG